MSQEYAKRTGLSVGDAIFALPSNGGSVLKLDGVILTQAARNVVPRLRDAANERLMERIRATLGETAAEAAFMQVGEPEKETGATPMAKVVDEAAEGLIVEGEGGVVGVQPLPDPDAPRVFFAEIS